MAPVPANRSSTVRPADGAQRRRRWPPAPSRWSAGPRRPGAPCSRRPRCAPADDAHACPAGTAAHTRSIQCDLLAETRRLRRLEAPAPRCGSSAPRPPRPPSERLGRDRARLLQQRPVAEQRGHVQVAQPRLPLAEQLALPRAAVGLGQREPVVGAGEERQRSRTASSSPSASRKQYESLRSPAHPAPQLVQLRQPEAPRAQDDHDGGVGHVHTHLDDRRAHQHVRLAGGVGGHGRGLLGRRQLPVQQPQPEAGQLARRRAPRRSAARRRSAATSLSSISGQTT